MEFFRTPEWKKSSTLQRHFCHLLLHIQAIFKALASGQALARDFLHSLVFWHTVFSIIEDLFLWQPV